MPPAHQPPPVEEGSIAFVIVHGPFEELAVGELSDAIPVGRRTDVAIIARVTHAAVFRRILPADLVRAVRRCVA